MEMLIRAICLVGGYGVGLIQTAYIYGRIKGVDIRKYGSGNAGTTNALRVLGKKAGLIVFLGDFLKGIIACSLTHIILGIIINHSLSDIRHEQDDVRCLYGYLCLFSHALKYNIV